MTTIKVVPPTLLLLLLLAAALVLPAVPGGESAISCGTVASKLIPCVTYLSGNVPSPSDVCCSGVKSLNNAAATTLDRRAVCQCLVAASKSYSRIINVGNIPKLPGKCSVKIPYTLSPNTDCSRVN